MLVSYAFYNGGTMDRLVRDLLTTGEELVFGDSGAHTARTKGLALTMDGYAGWAARWDKQLTLYANLDVIGAPEATWKHQAYMVERGLVPLPVVHTSAPWEYLDRYLDAGYTYIALGKLLGNPLRVLMPWLEHAFRRAEGRAVFHGFGMTNAAVVRELPFYSIDSSSWAASYRFGSVRLFDAGRWRTVFLRDAPAVLEVRDLIRDHGGDPLILADRERYSYLHAAAIAATAWGRFEQWARDRHGPVTVPDGPLNPLTRGGRAGPGPGLHLYLADTNPTHFQAAFRGLTPENRGT
jgi:hypothetical protein